MGVRRKQVTLRPTGSAGSATATLQWTTGYPGVVRFIKVNYGSGVPATTDLVIKADNSDGRTLFTKTDNTTDIELTPVGMPGIDEGGAAVAATDSSSGGFPFLSGLYFDIAQADPYVNSTDEIIIDILYDR